MISDSFQYRAVLSSHGSSNVRPMQKKRSAQKRQATLSALAQLQREKRTITKGAVARQAGVSLVFLRSYPDLVQAIEEAARTREATASPTSPGSFARDQVIAALRRRLGDMKQQLAAKDRELRGKQREIDRLYGKLAAASPLTDAELRRTLTDALDRLAQCEMNTSRDELGGGPGALSEVCSLQARHDRGEIRES